jgi:hypothetical protein
MVEVELRRGFEAEAALPGGAAAAEPAGAELLDLGLGFDDDAGAAAQLGAGAGAVRAALVAAELLAPVVGAAGLAAPDGWRQAVVAEAAGHQYGGEVQTMCTLALAIPASTSFALPRIRVAVRVMGAPLLG